jgi:hypothetical protein
MLRRARRRVVILNHRDEFLAMDVESNLEQRAAPHYLQLSRRGCGGHTVENDVLFHRAGESTKTRPRPLHAIYALQRTRTSRSGCNPHIPRAGSLGLGVRQK